MRIATGFALMVAACGVEKTPPAVPREGTGNAVIMRASRCAMIQGEKGPCILWGPALVELVTRPEEFDGKRVRVIGFVNFEFEGNGLYFSREDWRQGIATNSVWIEPPAGFDSDSGPPMRQPNRRYVIVEGTFRASLGGHFGMWSATLEKVTRLERWGPDSADVALTSHR